MSSMAFHCVLRARARICVYVYVYMCVACAEVSVACCVVVAFVFCVVAVCFLSCLGSHAFVRHVCMTCQSAHCTCVLPLTCRRKTNSVSKIRCSTIAFRAKKDSSIHISFICTYYHAREVTISAHQQYMSICRQKRCSSVFRNSLPGGHTIYKSMSYPQAACETPPVANGSLTSKSFTASSTTSSSHHMEPLLPSPCVYACVRE